MKMAQNIRLITRKGMAKTENEILAEQYQGGDKSAAAQLWAQNFPLVYSLAWKYYRAHKAQCVAAGVTLEDLQQESFFVILGAARAYDPSKGVKLAAYFTLQAKHRFREITGQHGSIPVLNIARSIDEPMPGTDGMTVADITDDPSAVTAFDDAEERVRNEELHTALCDALERCTAAQREGIEHCYFKARTQRAAAETLGITQTAVKIRVQGGMSRIRHSPAVMKRLRGFVEYGAAYNATGRASWNRNGSVEERLLERAWMKHERAERQAGN